VTLTQLITRVLRRTGLSTSDTEYQGIAREYINQILAEVMPMVPWWWLDRTTTFATVASTRTYSPVSGNVTNWWSFVDETNNRTLDIIGPDSYDSFDPDRSETGNPRAVYVSGVNTSTGYPEIDLFPLPDAANTIRVRYRAEIAEWTSSNDATSLSALGIPRVMESVLLYGATSLYMEDEGDDGSSGVESSNFQRALRAAKEQNLAMQGNKKNRPVGVLEDNPTLINVDSTLAVPS